MLSGVDWILDRDWEREIVARTDPMNAKIMLAQTYPRFKPKGGTPEVDAKALIEKHRERIRARKERQEAAA